MVDDQTLSDLLCHCKAVISFDQRQSQINPRSDAGGGPDIAILDEDAVAIDRDPRRIPLQLGSRGKAPTESATFPTRTILSRHALSCLQNWPPPDKN